MENSLAKDIGPILSEEYVQKMPPGYKCNYLCSYLRDKGKKGTGRGITLAPDEELTEELLDGFSKHLVQMVYHAAEFDTEKFSRQHTDL